MYVSLFYIVSDNNMNQKQIIMRNGITMKSIMEYYYPTYGLFYRSDDTSCCESSKL